MTESVNGAAYTQSLSMPSLGPTGSIHFAFAQLQLEQARACKEAANTYMKEIRQSQSDTKELSAMIDQARKLKADAKKGKVKMPDKMANFFSNNKISLGKGTKDGYDEDNWEYNIQSLKNFQEGRANDVQQLMVYLQDFIGQYNAYIQGANSSIRDGVQVTQSLLTNR